MWELAAVDTGVEEGVPERVVRMRELVAEALAAANNGADYLGTHSGTGVAATLIRVDGTPSCIRTGVVEPLDDAQAQRLADTLAGDDPTVGEIHWVADIPLRRAA